MFQMIDFNVCLRRWFAFVAVAIVFVFLSVSIAAAQFVCETCGGNASGGFIDQGGGNICSTCFGSTYGFGNSVDYTRPSPNGVNGTAGVVGPPGVRGGGWTASGGGGGVPPGSPGGCAGNCH